MSSFDIHFTGEERVDDGLRLARLILNLDSFVEGDEADLTTWSTADYETQWRNEIKSIVSGQTRGALITSIHDPRTAFQIWTWPMWSEQGTVHFQNRILSMLEANPSFDPSLIRDHIGDREELTEDGVSISQWSVPLNALETFLNEGRSA